MQFNPKLATKVYGSSRAAWFQSGLYFDGHGNLVSLEEAALPNPEDITPEVVTPVVATPEPITATLIERPVVPEAEVFDAPIERPANATNWGDDKLLKLKKMTPKVLSEMVRHAGGSPFSGFGSKAKNVEWLMANVE